MAHSARPTQASVLTRGVRIAWLEWSGQDVPLLAIPGITANAHAFDGLARALAPKYGVLAMDLRGRGESTAPTNGYDVETHACDALAVLDAAGIASCPVVGWSLGGKVALALGALHPQRVRAIVALDPPLITGPLARAALRRFWSRLTNTYRTTDEYVERMADAPLFGGRNATVTAYLRADVFGDADGTVRHRVHPRIPEAELAAEAYYSTAGYLPRVRCPTLILRSVEPISAEGDAVLSDVDARTLVAALPNGRLVEMAGVNHFSMLLRDPPAAAVPTAAFLAERE